MFKAIKQAFFGKAGFSATILAYLLVLLTVLAVIFGLSSIEDQAAKNAQQALLDKGYSQALSESISADGRDIVVSPINADDAAKQQLISVIESGEGVRWAEYDQNAELVEPQVGSIGQKAVAGVKNIIATNVTESQEESASSGVTANLAVDQTDTKVGVEPAVTAIPVIDVAADAPVATALIAYFDRGNLKVTGNVPDQADVTAFTKAITSTRRSGLTTIELRDGAANSEMRWKDTFLFDVAGIPGDAVGKITANDQSGVEIIPGELQALVEAEVSTAALPANVALNKQQPASEANVQANQSEDATSASAVTERTEAEVTAGVAGDVQANASTSAVIETEANAASTTEQSNGAATNGSLSVGLSSEGTGVTTAGGEAVAAQAHATQTHGTQSQAGMKTDASQANAQTKAQVDSQAASKAEAKARARSGFSMGMNLNNNLDVATQGHQLNNANTVTRAPAPQANAADTSSALAAVANDAQSQNASPLDYIFNLNYSLAGKSVFQSGNAKITPAFSTKLREVAGFLHAYPNTLLRIVGNVDFSVDPRDGEYIGVQRARAVRDFLRRQKVDSFRIFAAPLPRGYAFDEQTQIVFYISE